MASNTLTSPSVTSLDEARAMEAAWCTLASKLWLLAHYTLIPSQ
jgi:hypothetical protein